MDAGNYLIHGKHFRPKRGAQAGAATDPNELKRRLARAELLAKVYQKMGVQGMAVGALELGLGMKTLKRLARKFKLPLLAANLKDRAGRRPFPASKMVTVAGIKIGLIGLTGIEGRFKAKLDPADFKLEDPKLAAAREAKALRARGAQLVVALAAVGYNPARELGQKTAGLDFIFVSGTGRYTMRMDKVGKSWMAETAREGKYIGHLSLHFKGGSFDFKDLSERLYLADRLQKVDQSIMRLEARMKGPSNGKRQDWLVRRLQSSKNSRTRMAQQLYKANKLVPKGSFMVNHLQACDKGLPEDQAISALIDEATKAHGLRRVNMPKRRGRPH